MNPVLTRRTLALAATSLIVAPARATTAGPIAAIERAHGGRLGVFAMDTANTRTLAHRADDRFLLQSSFKGVLAAYALSRVDAGTDSLDQVVTFDPRKLLPNSPVSSAHAASGRMTVGDLCQAILEHSDNTAANTLMAHVGGPGAVTAYARSKLGDTVTRIDRYELVPGWSGIEDTTTPRAIAGQARAMVLGDALKPASRTRLQRWMSGNVAGAARLRAAFPPGWAACDRTGTGDGVCNDYAVAWPPGRAPLVMAAYYEHQGAEQAAQEAVLREVGAAVVAWAGAAR